MALHTNPREALVVGLGGGATAGAVGMHTGVNVDIVELSPAVAHAAQFFDRINYGVLGRPNVRLRVDDGRNHLMLTRWRYDVIYRRHHPADPRGVHERLLAGILHAGAEGVE